jgi:hypothetical protein
MVAAAAAAALTALLFSLPVASRAQMTRSHTTVAATEHELVLIPAGVFTMGSMGGKADEQPPHDVFLDDYYIDIFELTNQLYDAFLNDGGSHRDMAGNTFVDVGDPDARIRRTRAGTYRVSRESSAHSPVERGQLVGRRCLLRLGGPAAALRGDVGEGGARYRRTDLPLGREDLARQGQLRERGHTTCLTWPAMSGNSSATGMARATMP